MRKINPELWLLLCRVLIAAMLNFLIASQRIALVFYFLPTLFSAYYLGRRHATLTAFASVVLVVAMACLNPAMFTRHVDFPFAKWFDIAVWGGVLMVAGYATGTLYRSATRKRSARSSKAMTACSSSCRISWRIRNTATPMLTAFPSVPPELQKALALTPVASKISERQDCFST